MLKFIYDWFKLQKPITKVFIVLFLLALSYAAYKSIRLAKSEYDRLKYIEHQYQEAQEEINKREENESKIIDSSKKQTKKTSKKKTEIDEKLKQDEKSIDDSSVTDDDIKSFISKHQEG
jgi:septal ring factor EnvC (AmiA/AmiB activator)